MTSWEFIPKMHYKIITMIKKTNSESAYFWFRSYQIEYLNDSLLKAKHEK